MTTYTTPCHICGEPVVLHPATETETERHGYDYAEGEYLIGRCRRRQHADGSRTHYGHVENLVHISEAYKEA